MSIMTKLVINGFKSIWDAEIELGQLNVFIGTNGAGKSNLLEAIAMLSASVEGGLDYERLARRGARLSSHEIFRSALKNKRNKDLTLSAEFGDYCYKTKINAQHDFSYHSEKYENTASGEKYCGRSYRGTTVSGVTIQKIIEKDKSVIPLYKILAEDQKSIDALDSLENYAIYAPSTPILRGVTPDTSNKSPLGLYGGRLAEAFAEAVNDNNTRTDLQRFFKMLDWFKSVEVIKGDVNHLLSEHVHTGSKSIKYVDKFMNMKFNQLHAYDVSEGALYIMFVLLLLSHKNAPNIFSLDNVDNALNPGLVRNLMNHVVELLKNHPEKQVFLTTHNPTTLDSIDLFNNDHRLFVVSRSDDGQTNFTRITPPSRMTRSEWEEKYYGMKLSEIWLSGAIGGLPNNFI